ncbi:TetR family transcriptional regulator [Gordonia jinghuaiqii]|uniref:TetR/AcrR family transcriptional regulator n=1 Tax=Gordonia jinghuaiqii TaxID=2758710 RepID=A0A7D7R217_9ACTN|nr:TetR/AcrR family transcriptional regulator [Gordonia jinghuaiqii]MCR5979931.1 TetR family transcriptional regulator [Gordonia jinghuaiqii]QMT03131.1 TetR/AcrR family transcriptional regulator [Gordonia jinghuaiqii]
MARPSRWTELVEAAGEEFRIRGYDSATLEDIAARVGILKGSIYNYVQNKEELLLAVVERPAQVLLADLEQLRNDAQRSATVRLRTLFRIQVRVFSEHHPAAFVYLRNIGRTDLSDKFGRFTEMDAQYMDILEDLIADGVARGEFNPPVSPRIAALSVVGILNWMQHWFTPQGDELDRRLADDLFAMALGGLTAGGSLAHILANTHDAEAVPR